MSRVWEHGVSLQNVASGAEKQEASPEISPDAEAALRQEMLALLPDLRAFARFLVRDRSAADDLVQDTIVRSLSALPQFQIGTNLKAWLFTILRNQFFEQTRRRRREANALSAGFPVDEAARAEQGDIADLRDLSRLLWRLPPLLRESLVLVGAQELTHDEAARICGVPVGTMKARVSRARTQLAKIMQPPGAVGEI
jgi:RNA polymerase sigma-70 factor (ECF subfamily)